MNLQLQEPNGAAVKGKKRRISNLTLDGAAQELGMLTVNAKKLKSYATIGQFLDQVGVIPYSNGKLIGTAEALQRAITTCADIVANREIELPMRRDFMQLQLDLCKALDDNTAKLIDINNAPAQGSMRGAAVKPFQIGQPITPVTVPLQVNIQNAPVEKTEGSG